MKMPRQSRPVERKVDRLAVGVAGAYVRPSDWPTEPLILRPGIIPFVPPYVLQGRRL